MCLAQATLFNHAFKYSDTDIYRFDLLVRDVLRARFLPLLMADRES